MDYYHKYSKYKHKYLELKQMQNGGQPKCRNNCGRIALGRFPTCCQACVSNLGPHTQQCDQRNLGTAQYIHTLETIVLNKPLPSRKSVDINSISPLYAILSNIQAQLSQLPNYQPARMTFHIELVDDTSDTNNKNNNYAIISNQQIDLCAKANWYCHGGAFSLLIGKYIGHATPVHITVGYFGNYQNCQNILVSAHNIVSNILGKQLH